MTDDLSPEQRKWLAEDARQLLENKLFRGAFEAVEGYLVGVAESCDPDNKDKAQRVVISMQLLKALKREIERQVEDGAVADVEIAELERKRGITRFFR